MDAADELATMILERLNVLNEMDLSIFDPNQPTRCGSIQRWIEDVRREVTRFNLRAVEAPLNPITERLPDWQQRQRNQLRDPGSTT